MLIYISIAVITLSLASGYLLGWHGHARMLQKRRAAWNRYNRWTYVPTGNGTGAHARWSEEDL